MRYSSMGAAYLHIGCMDDAGSVAGLPPHIMRDPRREP